MDSLMFVDIIGLDWIGLDWIELHCIVLYWIEVDNACRQIVGQSVLIFHM